jgi:DNA end-binding protein Ku
MARSIWTGVISFGLVAVPVKIFSATHDHDVSFHQFEKGTSDRIRYQRVNERTGKEVDYADIVKGADVGGGAYVMLDQDELDSVAPGRSRALEILTFIDQADIDPIYYQKTYYLAPGSDETARTYALLRDAMAEADRVAIGTLVMRGKEYLAAIRPDRALLVLETMFFADEIRDPNEELDQLPSRAKTNPKELKIAAQLIESMTGPWKPAEFRDTYTDRVKKLIQAKRKGKEVTMAEEAPEPTNAVDLMTALRASVEAARQRRTGSRKADKPASRRPASKATVARKPTAKATKKAAAGKTPPRKDTAKATAAIKSSTKTAKKTAKKAKATKAAPGKRQPAKKAAPAKRSAGKAA